jgi:pyruvate-ferredoxin/flavodoxin oxidoreductase
VESIDILKAAAPGATLLLNSPYDADNIWENLPPKVQQQIIDKNLKVYAINASQVAKNSGMGHRINTIMQVCFFALAGVLPEKEAIAKIKQAIEKTYGKKGAEVVNMNLKAVDNTLENLHEVGNRSLVIGNRKEKQLSITKPKFIENVLDKIMVWEGDDLPVSALPADGTFPSGTAKWEKRNVAEEIPVWDGDVCVQCGKCVMVCPHAAIRAKTYQPSELVNAPITFKSTNSKDKNFANQKFTIQVAPEDCTGCEICVSVCPAKNKAEPTLKAINMSPQLPLREQERENWNFFLNLPNPDRKTLKVNQIRQQQLQEPLFEFSGEIGRAHV